MSVVIETFIICDGCYMNYGVDFRSLPAYKHRESARANGWRLVKGKDYCPTCQVPRESNLAVASNKT